MSGRSIQARVAAIADDLPESQRLVARLLTDDPEGIAFGTLQSVAERAGTSTPTVIRFAGRLGFDGFTALRDEVRGEVSQRLQSAAARVHQEPKGHLLERARAVEIANLEATFDTLDDATLAQATDLLADQGGRIWILPSSQMAGVGSHFADQLGLCRSGVVLLEGSEFRIMTRLAGLRLGDVLVSLDVQRHERWLVRVQRDAVARGAVPLAVTDRLPCSLDLTGGLALNFACDTTSPFDSQVGLLAVANVLVSAVAEQLRPQVARRVDALEATWVDHHLFDG